MYFDWLVSSLMVNKLLILNQLTNLSCILHLKLTTIHYSLTTNIKGEVAEPG